MKRIKLVPDLYKVPRTIRIASLVTRGISQVLSKHFPEVLASTQVSRVQMSKCLAHATVYITNEDVEARSMLVDATHKIRRLLAQTVRMRRVPELRFEVDKHLMHQIKIGDLLTAATKSRQ